MDRPYFDPCKGSLLESLCKLDKATITAALSPWITPAQIDAILVRRDLIVSHFDKLNCGEGRVGRAVSLGAAAP